jgi:carbonic anhydrase
MHDLHKVTGWDYIDQDWAHHGFEQCDGSSQSPIDLSGFSYDENLAPLSFDYGTVTANMQQSGYGLLLPFADGTGTQSITGSLLSEAYVLDSIHFHWGSEDSAGAEHTVNGVHHPLELHYVHRKGSFTTTSDAVASGEPGALAVVGVIFAIDEVNNNAALDGIIGSFGDIWDYEFGATDNPSTSVSVDLMSFFPADHSTFVTYTGSLTTPTCDEIVAWHVFKNFAPVSHAQMESFRNFTVDGEPIGNLYRDVQPRNGRVIYSNDPADEVVGVSTNFGDNWATFTIIWAVFTGVVFGWLFTFQSKMSKIAETTAENQKKKDAATRALSLKTKN